MTRRALFGLVAVVGAHATVPVPNQPVELVDHLGRVRRFSRWNDPAVFDRLHAGDTFSARTKHQLEREIVLREENLSLTAAMKRAGPGAVIYLWPDGTATP